MNAETVNKPRPGSMSERALTFFNRITVEGSNKTHQCNIGDCGNLIVGTKLSNLVAHIKSCHTVIYNNDIHILNNNKRPAYYAKKRLVFIQNCVEIVTVNARPFKYLLDSGFKKIVYEQLKELAEGNCGIDLNSENLTEIKKYIENTATKIVEQIKMEVKNKMLSVMVDIATKNNKSLIGISLQYILNGAIKVRSIGMIEMKELHTASYILQLLKACLSSYDISSKQVMSITSDNASNMIAMMNTFNDEEFGEG